LNLEIILSNYKIKEGLWDSKIQRDEFKGWNVLTNVKDRGLIISKNRRLNFIDHEGHPFWNSSVLISGIPQEAYISKDRLIITTTTDDYHAWGFLGPTLLKDLETGITIKELKGEIVKELYNGEFLLALEGYELFDTWHYDREGNLIQKWKSYGKYLLVNDEIIVIEENRQNNNSSSLAKLNRDGSILKGPKLKSPRSSNPIFLNKNNFLFENGGHLIIVDKNLNVTTIHNLIQYSSNDSWRFSSRITQKKGLIVVEILERIKEPIENYHTHIWKIRL
jgi:hypothetical protein